jgi:hypothetical protein
MIEKDKSKQDWLADWFSLVYFIKYAINLNNFQSKSEMNVYLSDRLNWLKYYFQILFIKNNLGKNNW